MYPLFYLSESLESTNEAILNYHTPSRPNIAIYTFNQINGKGQYGNTWKMPKDQNIAYSLLIDASLIPIGGNFVNFYTAVIIRDFLDNLSDEEVFIKWPNDIIINRKKVVGILIEQIKIDGKSFYIIGIGINVLQRDFSELTKAGSILTQTHQRFNLASLSENFHFYFTKHITHQPSYNILERYNHHLFCRNSVALFSKSNIRQNGIIQYADEKGFLHILLEKDGLQKFFHKEIEMLY